MRGIGGCGAASLGTHGSWQAALGEYGALLKEMNLAD